MNTQQLKKDVYHYWNTHPCGKNAIKSEPLTPAYFNEIECNRYYFEPEIFSFAQFTRFYKKQVLEVGVGVGTDFVQWVRAGAYAHGIDLTHEAIAQTKKRLEMEGLEAVDLRRADAECLPYPDNCFDVTYSWGVLHHAPDIKQCLSELIRVTKPSGVIKIMVYNRASLFTFYQWFKHALCKGKPFKSLSQVLYFTHESVGTRAYTRSEIKKLIYSFDAEILSINAPVTNHDLLYRRNRFYRICAYILASLFGWRTAGRFMMVEIRKK